MIGIVVVGHNEFAKGLNSTVEMIGGKQDQFETVSFLEGANPEDLYADIKNAVSNVDTGEGVLIFTDLKGGTPFIQSALLKSEGHNIEVLTGSNIAMLLEAALVRFTANDITEFANNLVNLGKTQVDMFTIENMSKENNNEEDGI